MANQAHPLADLLARDKRYRFEAYAFVFEALSYAHNVMGLGGGPVADKDDEDDEPAETAEMSEAGEVSGESAEPERHITGQELCEAIRRYALDQYGYMAKCVLNSWGVTETGDFGEIVFNLIEIGSMRKQPEDRREDFNDVFEFETGLNESFRITIPEQI